ncbi:hypothetical protein PG985_011539 [Apiospora marii]|uniref:Uncharacterized protein n=1 Tax=Apiospora marii TaxID=335849 RepID=A0ABR1R2M6_9PEZI
MAYSVFGLLGLCWPWSNKNSSSSIMDDTELYYRQQEDIVAAEYHDQQYRNAVSQGGDYQRHVMSPDRNYGTVRL